MIRYSAPINLDPTVGLIPYTDANYLTILCQQNEVDGLLSKSRAGEWFKVNPHPGCYVVVVGQSLRAWSNGRLHAPLHKVMISGEKDRFSCGLFLMPKGDEVVQAPEELVEGEHLPLFKPFTYVDFLKHSRVNEAGKDVLDVYART